MNSHPSDPTSLTTAQLLREIESLKELVMSRLDALDKASALFHEDITRVPTDVDKQISSLKELMQETFKTVDEKFAKMENQFIERDIRVKDASIATSAAVAAALQAAKDAVGEQNKSFALSIDKSEAATTKQIDALVASNQTAIYGLTTILNDLKERFTRMESLGLGASASKQEAVAERRNDNNYLIAVIGTALSLAGLIAFILIKG